MSSGTRIVRAAIVATVLAQFGFAQMRGGMSGGLSSGPSSGISSGMAGMSGGMSGAMQGAMGSGMGHMSGPVVGSDGTAYVLRTTTATTAGTTQQTVKTELIAVNPQTGKANWKLQIDGTRISQPVLGKDGSIYLTTSEPPIGGTASTRKPALVIVAPGATAARVQSRLDITADALSAPEVSPDGQIIYVVAVDMPTGTSGSGATTAAVSPTLYIFSAGGSLKFKVQLSQL